MKKLQDIKEYVSKNNVYVSEFWQEKWNIAKDLDSVFEIDFANKDLLNQIA